MRNWGGWWIIIAIMLLIDLYVFMAVRTVSQNSGEKTKIALYSAFWLVSVIAVVTIALFPYVRALQENPVFRNYLFAIIIGLL